jgi:hypothetical protein
MRSNDRPAQPHGFGIGVARFFGTLRFPFSNGDRRPLDLPVDPLGLTLFAVFQPSLFDGIVPGSIQVRNGSTDQQDAA